METLSTAFSITSLNVRLSSVKVIASYAVRFSILNRNTTQGNGRRQNVITFSTGLRISTHGNLELTETEWARMIPNGERQKQAAAFVGLKIACSFYMLMYAASLFSIRQAIVLCSDGWIEFTFISCRNQ